MPTIHYYGKKTCYVGKTLFEILGNLRNFGVGRMLIKQEELILFAGKPSYYIVKKVEPMMDESLKQGAIYAERIFNGRKMPELVFIDWESWHPDWQLIPKLEEAKYRVDNPPLYEEPKAEDKSFDAPPLMNKFLQRYFNRTTSTKSETIKLDYQAIDLNWGMEPSKPMAAQLGERFRNK